jgi:hypothetical protein
MDSGEHNGFVQEWKTLLENIEEVGKRTYVGDTATPGSVLEHNSHQ